MFSHNSMNAVGEFLHHPWDNTCHAVHDLTRQKDQNITQNGFSVSLDVSHFQPSEIRVKTVNNTIVVEAKHAERDDGHGPVERHLVRKYVLPMDYDMNTIHSALSSDGMLIIKVPLPKANTPAEKNVPIIHSNIVAN